MASPAELSEPLLRAIAAGAAASISPLCAFIGGIAAQEVLKAASGKFGPISQFFYFDATEALPTPIDQPLPPAEIAPQGSRYDGMVAVFGRTVVEKLKGQRYFLVGAGAIGCEMLKNWALMGLGAGAGGQITVTDPDCIEKSNLNRQFLFRPWDVSKPKSVCAAAKVVEMNGEVRIDAQTHKVGEETEDVYTDDFMEGLSVSATPPGCSAPPRSPPPCPAPPPRVATRSAARRLRAAHRCASGRCARTGAQALPRRAAVLPRRRLLLLALRASATRWTTCTRGCTWTRAPSTTRSRCSSRARSARRATCRSDVPRRSARPRSRAAAAAPAPSHGAACPSPPASPLLLRAAGPRLLPSFRARGA